jgi:hypothetical protein
MRGEYESDDDESYAQPITNPVDKFAHLPEPTRRWLEGLREDDLDEIAAAIKFYRSARVVGRFNRWLIITVAAVFVGTVAFGEAIQKLWGWMSPWHVRP